MQQRQLRLGDILDDYCPRERRLTNHAVVAMIGEEVKQTRCTTCDTEHEYKHAKVPRQRRKSETPAALYSQVAAGRPKRIPHDFDGPEAADADDVTNTAVQEPAPEEPIAAASTAIEPSAEPSVAAVEDTAAVEDVGPVEDVAPVEDPENEIEPEDHEDGPVHRPLIRATLPRAEGQPPPARQNPEFTIRQPGGRANRFRPRHQRGGGEQFFGNRQNGNMGGAMRGGPRQGGSRPPQGSAAPRAARRQGPRKRSK